MASLASDSTNSTEEEAPTLSAEKTLQQVDDFSNWRFRGYVNREVPIFPGEVRSQRIQETNCIFTQISEVKLAPCVAIWGKPDPSGDVYGRNHVSSMAAVWTIRITDTATIKYFEDLDRYLAELVYARTAWLPSCDSPWIPDKYFARLTTEKDDSDSDDSDSDDSDSDDSDFVSNFFIYKKALSFDKHRRYDPILYIDVLDNIDVFIPTDTDSEGHVQYVKATIDAITYYTKIIPTIKIIGLRFSRKRYACGTIQERYVNPVISVNKVIIWRHPINYMNDGCFQTVLSYLFPCNSRRFACVCLKWRRMLKVLWKQRLVALDSTRWPTIYDFDDVSVAELEEMHDGHPTFVVIG